MVVILTHWFGLHFYILLSVFAHGISAAPTINVYAKQTEKLDADVPERRDAVKMPGVINFLDPKNVAAGVKPAFLL